MGNQRDTLTQLRSEFDGTESFMNHGHQIISPRSKRKKIPDWTKSDEKVREVLLRSFPKLATDPKQRLQASRWIRVIHLYFRMNMTYGEVSDELGTTIDGELVPFGLNKTWMLINRIKRVGIGRRGDNTGKLGNPKGRPKKKKHDLIETS